MTNERIISASQNEEGQRVDSFLSAKLENMSRSAVQHLLEEQSVFLEGKPLKKNYRIVGNENITVLLPELREVAIEPEAIPLDIIYEDMDIIVINKPRGMVVHPAAGNWTGTLVNALMYHCGDSLSGINGEHRPGIVHRIDKDTSGLLVVAKNDAAHRSLAAQIAAHTACREYEAVVIGSLPEEEGSVNQPIARHKTDRKKMAIDPNGRTAVTHYHVLRRFSGYTYAGFTLETGRTHQIRVHMASIGHPIIGDPVYGRPRDCFSNIGGQCLHAVRLTLTHPSTNEIMTFSAPLPQYFTDILQKLEHIG